MAEFKLPFDHIDVIGLIRCAFIYGALGLAEEARIYYQFMLAHDEIIEEAHNDFSALTQELLDDFKDRDKRRQEKEAIKPPFSCISGYELYEHTAICYLCGQKEEQRLYADLNNEQDKIYESMTEVGCREKAIERLCKNMNYACLDLKFPAEYKNNVELVWSSFDYYESGQIELGRIYLQFYEAQKEVVQERYKEKLDRAEAKLQKLGSVLKESNKSPMKPRRKSWKIGSTKCLISPGNIGSKIRMYVQRIE